jgi:hypothetical protein
MIQTESIKSIFDEKYIKDLFFGELIKTFVIPAKYDQNNTFYSQNGEY